MKKIILSIFSLLVFGVIVNAQKGVGIETSDVRDGAILDFPTNAKKGILLPRVENTNNAGTAYGTFVYDKASKKVLVYGNVDNANKWIELTTEANNTPLKGNLNPNGKTETSNGVVIEDGTSASEVPEGVLSLESQNRALALPAVDDATKIRSPKAGLICYDKKSKSLAVFNGKKWYFWR